MAFNIAASYREPPRANWASSTSCFALARYRDASARGSVTDLVRLGTDVCLRPLPELRWPTRFDHWDPLPRHSRPQPMSRSTRALQLIDRGQTARHIQ